MAGMVLMLFCAAGIEEDGWRSQSDRSAIVPNSSDVRPASAEATGPHNSDLLDRAKRSVRNTVDGAVLSAEQAGRDVIGQLLRNDQGNTGRRRGVRQRQDAQPVIGIEDRSDSDLDGWSELETSFGQGDALTDSQASSKERFRRAGGHEPAPKPPVRDSRSMESAGEFADEREPFELRRRNRPRSGSDRVAQGSGSMAGSELADWLESGDLADRAQSAVDRGAEQLDNLVDEAASKLRLGTRQDLDAQSRVVAGQRTGASQGAGRLPARDSYEPAPEVPANFARQAEQIRRNTLGAGGPLTSAGDANQALETMRASKNSPSDTAGLRNSDSAAALRNELGNRQYIPTAARQASNPTDIVPVRRDREPQASPGVTSDLPNVTGTPADTTNASEGTFNGQQIREALSARPWWPLLLAVLGLFGSLGFNIYLGWIAWDLYSRYQEAVDDVQELEERLDTKSKEVAFG